jgi:hypothetical protein
VIDRVEAGDGAIDGVKKGEDVHAAEGASKWTVEQMLKIAERAAGQAIDVGD